MNSRDGLGRMAPSSLNYYEVEVTLDDGNQVAVQLDQSFNVVGSGGDRDGSGED